MLNETQLINKRLIILNSYLQLQILLASIFVCVLLTGPIQAASVSSGQKIYNRCIACHSLSYSRTGPKHCGLFGRKAGTVQGYDYSIVMKNSHIVWSKITLDGFLKSPLDYLPGTTMGYAGIKNDTERADLIAYLEQATQSNKCK